MNKYLDDLFYWLGALLITAGAYSIYRPAAFLTMGFFCLLFSYLVAKARAK